MHLFDIDIPGEITFKESDSLSAGSQLAVIDVKDFKIGIGICYDIRFEELAKLYRKKGCNMLIYPGAFNMKTGPLHWELLARSRANDNQCYTALVSPARDVSAGYVAWGHSMVVDPWGKVMNSAGPDEEVFVTEIGKTPKSRLRLLLIFSLCRPSRRRESPLEHPNLQPTTRRHLRHGREVNSAVELPNVVLWSESLIMDFYVEAQCEREFRVVSLIFL